MSNGPNPERPLRVVDLAPEGLSKLQPGRVRLILGLVDGPAAYAELSPQTPLTFGEALVYWTVERIVAGCILPEHLCMLAGQLFGKEIRQWGEAFWATRTQLEQLPELVPVVAIADRRYLSGPPDLKRCYDMASGTWEERGGCTIEGISYNLLALAVQEATRLQTTPG